MKTQTNILAILSKSTIATLTSEVKETLLIAKSKKSNKTFTAVDLWNIQRRSRTSALRTSVI